MTEYDVLRAFFSKLGLEGEAADMYASLRDHGPQSISELARSSGVPRMQIYRLLDTLKAAGIIEVELGYKRSILHATPLSNLQVLIAEKEQGLKDLEFEYKQLVARLSDHPAQSAPTKVRFYEGMDGLKQMLWDQTNAQGENLAILYDNMQNKTNITFFERWVRKCNERNLYFRGIICDHFVQTQQQWYGEHSNERLINWQPRYISEHDFPLTHTVVTYDDVVLYYDWNDERIFGIEVKNTNIARMQRQFFELLWRQSTSVDDLTGSRSPHPKSNDSSEIR